MSEKFPFDAPQAKVIRTLSTADGTRTPLTMPAHSRLKACTLRAICTKSGIPRDEFLKAHHRDG